jgi:hypothetical protein
LLAASQMRIVKALHTVAMCVPASLYTTS